MCHGKLLETTDFVRSHVDKHAIFVAALRLKLLRYRVTKHGQTALRRRRVSSYRVLLTEHGWGT
jgi:hypothetical protein